MKRQQTINIRSVLKVPNLAMRESANRLFSFIECTNKSEIEIDFSGVDFISRSFADQFYKSKIHLQKKINITIINCNSAVSKMLKTVEKTNAPDFIRNYKKTNFRVVRLSNQNSFHKLNQSF